MLNKHQIITRYKEKQYRNKFLVKVKNLCRYETNKLIKLGLIKVQICEVCELKAQVHHQDYLNPFDIKWFCRFHHDEYHRLTKDNI